jgi:hypothetical protein
MTKRTKGTQWTIAAVIATACGCGATVEQPPGGGSTTQSLRCSSAEYIAFDPTNHAAQDLRLQRIDEIIALFAVDPASPVDPADVANKASKAKDKYEASDANLAVKVQGREDLHFNAGDPRRSVGAELHQAILGAIEDLRSATTTTEVNTARHWVQKAGFYRFLYLSVNEELREPSYMHYDEAYGYLGTGQSNAEAGRRGLARLATSRDSGNGTTLASELFAFIKDGACIIEQALQPRNATSMALSDDAAYAAHVEKLDARLQLVFAYSLGHEIFEIAQDPTDKDVELVEALGFFRTLEPYLLAAPQGSPKRALGDTLKAALETAEAKRQIGEPWAGGFDATGLLQQIETTYGIDVKA